MPFDNDFDLAWRGTTNNSAQEARLILAQYTYSPSVDNAITAANTANSMAAGGYATYSSRDTTQSILSQQERHDHERERSSEHGRDATSSNNSDLSGWRATYGIDPRDLMLYPKKDPGEKQAKKVLPDEKFLKLKQVDEEDWKFSKGLKDKVSEKKCESQSIVCTFMDIFGIDK
jgi:hypothetical protein